MTSWISRLKRTLAAVAEPEQRAILFAAKTVTLKPDRAAILVDHILRNGFLKTDASSPLLLNAMVMSVVAGHWQGKHIEETVRQCYEREKRLAALFLNGLSTREGQASETILPVPEYSKERSLTLGERRSLAKQPDRRLIALAMGDPHPMVISNLLENPKLTESDIVSLASRRPASAQVLREVALHSRFRHSRRLAGALVNNPYLPIQVGLALLPQLDFPSFKELKKNHSIHVLLREAILEILGLISEQERGN